MPRTRYKPEEIVGEPRPLTLTTSADIAVSQERHFRTVPTTSLIAATTEVGATVSYRP